MLDQIVITMIDISLVLFGGVIVVLLYAANEIGFVSSNSWDVNGAGAAGLFTFWIQRSAAEPPESSIANRAICVSVARVC